MKCNNCGRLFDGNFCPNCGALGDENTYVVTNQPIEITSQDDGKIFSTNSYKPFYKRWQVWIIVIIIGIFLINMANLFGGNDKNSVPEFNWSNIVLSKMLPEPESNYGKSSINTKDYLLLDVFETSKVQYSSYVNVCRDKGFNIDIAEYGTTFTAKNKNEYQLMLFYFEKDEKMSINLTAPLEGQSEDKDESPSIDSPSNLSSNEVENSKITVTMSEDELKKLTTSDAEKKLREMGFTTFKYDTLEAGNRADLNGKIASVEIKHFEFGKGDFSKGDTYERDAIVVLWSYVYTEPEKPSPVFYSTNDYETATKGNTGVFSYKNKNGSYDVYWIIDFNDGYVYWFTDGNGETTCDKLKFTSGDLNSRIKVTWNDGGQKWSWYLHFKYTNSPVTLIVDDHNGFSIEYTTTNLNAALEIRDTKKMIEY